MGGTDLTAQHSDGGACVRRTRRGHPVDLRAWTALLLAAIATTLAACGGGARQRPMAMTAPHRAPAAGDKATATAPPDLIDLPNYRFAPGDLLDIKFPYHPEENERLLVRPDGRLTMQMIGDVVAAGLTVEELEKAVIERASRVLRGPVVNIVIVALAEHKVYVGGQVVRPGFVVFRQGMTPLDAIVERGGFTNDAQTNQVVYMHRVGEQVESRKLDLEAVVSGSAPEQIRLSPNDIVIVPRTFIGDADIFVDQWIRGLLPTIPIPGVDIPAFFF